MLGHPSVERGDPRLLLLDDGEQLDDHLAHDERGLFQLAASSTLCYIAFRAAWTARRAAVNETWGAVASSSAL